VALLRVELLGAPTLALDRDPLHFDTRKAVALLAVLAVTGRTHRREELAALLWPESDGPRGRAALRRTLFTASKVGPALRADRAGVALDPDLLACDVTTFQRLAAGGDPGSAQQAIKLYRGDFLAGFSLRDSPEWEEWRDHISDRLRADLDRLLGVLVDHHASRGEYDAAISFAQRRLTLDPLHEPAHQSLISLYAWSGQRTAAMRQYRACVRVLDRELGVAPLPATTHLYDAVRRDRTPAPPTLVVDTPAASVPPPGDVAGSEARVRPPTKAPFVGRQAEFDQLDESAQRAAVSGATVAVVGEVGSGKTALLDVFAGRHSASVVVRGHEGEQTLAFAAAADLVRALLATFPGTLDALGAVARGVLARLVPVIGTEAEPQAALDTPGAKTRLFDAVRTSLEAAGGTNTEALVVVLDDVHWFDEETRDLVAFLVRRPPAGVLLLPTWRATLAPTNVAAAVADAMRVGAGATLWLSALRRDEVEQLLAALGCGQVLDVDTVLARTGGLPMLVAEHALAARVADAAGPDAGVAGLVRARIDAAPATTVQLLAGVAVAAAPVDPDVLRGVSGRTEAEVVAALEDAVARGLLVEVPARDAYDFPHETLRQVVTERTSLARRRLLHSRMADVLIPHVLARSAASSAGAAATVARHLDLAGRAPEAATWHWSAAQEARALYAHATAAEHLQAAMAGGHDPAMTHLALGDVRLSLGEYGAAIESFEQAAALIESEPLLAEVEHKLAQVHHRLGDWDVAEAHLDSALALIQETPDASARRSQVLADSALVLLRRGQFDAARERAVAATEVAAAIGEPAALAQAYNVLAVLDARREVSAARNHLQVSLGHAEQLDDPGPAVAALNNLARLEADAGDLDAALDAATKALELGIRHGDRHRMGALHANLADLLHDAGREAEAREHVRASVVLLADVDRETERRPEVWKLVEW
jgi:DNA-binding SARP family transcriptional activator/tetratricopeptide (TPR) repeat protein